MHETGLHLPIVLKSGSFNFVETSGSLQASMGVALSCCVNTLLIFEVFLCIGTYYYNYYYYYYYLLQLSFHSAVNLTMVTNKNKYKRKIQKHGKYKCTYYQNTHTIVKTPTHYKTHTCKQQHIRKPTHTHVLQNKLTLFFKP